MSLERCANFAVLDTETNYSDKVMSVGVAIAEAGTFRLRDRLYILVDPEYKKPAMYSYSLHNSRAEIDAVLNRRETVDRIVRLLDRYDVEDIFAYNALFDKAHMPELNSYRWYDIMKLASNRNYNPAIPCDCPCYSTGRMKSGYSAENILRMLCGPCYSEAHNALTDAVDELDIMRLMGVELREYECARVTGSTMRRY